MAVFGGSAYSIDGLEHQYCDLNGDGFLGGGDDFGAVELILYGLTYRVHGAPDHQNFNASWYSNNAGFRCARTLSGDE